MGCGYWLIMTYEVKETQEEKCTICHIIMIYSLKLPIYLMQICYTENMLTQSLKNKNRLAPRKKVIL